MFLEESIASDRSKENMERIASYVLDHPNELSCLWSLMVHGDDSMKMRSAWAFGKVIELTGELFNPFMKDSLELVLQCNHDGLKRNLMRSFFYAPLNEEVLTPLFDLSNTLLMDGKETTAVRMFSMRTAFRIVQRYPELAQEFQQVLDKAGESIHSAGIRNSFSKIRKKNNELLSK